MNKGLDKIWLLNEFSKDIEQFKGNYDEFMEQKELENQQLAKRIKKQKKEYKKLLQVSQHLKGMSSNKAKMQGARYREKAMELKNKIPKQHKRSKKIKIEHNIKKKPGHTILTVQNVSKAFRTDDKLNQVLFDINFSLKRRNRLAIIGINGAGKSTLLKIIMKKIEPEDGPNGKAKIKYGYNTEIGYYAQEYDNVNKTNTPLEEFPRNQHQRVRRFLGNFLITQEQVNQRISTLSGGEKTRLALAKIFFHQPNVLVLDEPTTFLDPASQKILKQTLRDYPETIILVSHDKELVKSIEPTHVLLLPEEKFTNFYPSHLNRVEDF
jgi:ATP-binding cassette subfamily F protein 3